mmetsp:Transcript_57931/g.137887  ORF Transcript_57931/g.137887 Transcript_57931/m.137887 type:complete len:300 (+) Transcript_57931:2298-3197(+)
MFHPVILYVAIAATLQGDVQENSRSIFARSCAAEQLAGLVNLTTYGAVTGETLSVAASMCAVCDVRVPARLRDTLAAPSTLLRTARPAAFKPASCLTARVARGCWARTYLPVALSRRMAPSPASLSFAPVRVALARLGVEAGPLEAFCARANMASDARRVSDPAPDARARRASLRCLWAARRSSMRVVRALPWKENGKPSAVMAWRIWATRRSVDALRVLSPRLFAIEAGCRCVRDTTLVRVMPLGEESCERRCRVEAGVGMPVALSASSHPPELGSQGAFSISLTGRHKGCPSWKGAG